MLVVQKEQQQHISCVLPCVAVCCRVLQCVVRGAERAAAAVCCSVSQCIAVYCSVLQCVAQKEQQQQQTFM